MPRAYLVYNPAAGRFPSHLLAERAARVLRQHGWDLSLWQTLDGEHILRLARQAAEAGMEAFFMAGGDGSLNQALGGLIGTETALGVLPAGTANVWAQELGLPGLTWTRWLALEESARRLTRPVVRQVDLGLCNDRPFLLWAGVGLDAFVVHHMEPRSPLEKNFAVAHYAASVVWHASLWRGMNLQVEADGRQVSGKFLLASVSNVHLYAGGYALLSPEARLDDGLMDLWLFEGDTLADLVQLGWDLGTGRHRNSSQVKHLPFFHDLRLEAEKPLFVQVDGEPAPASHTLTIKTLPQALRVLVPENTPYPLFVDRKAPDW
jgi:YegS/Rv2252/BmrU family lipid kinase